ncbi:MAG: hypothetical protein JWM68_3230 [Verrucomicrobiales bacterium]|nr:hypothetical protein [Verrucomicrobiales bacterium]
MGEFSRMLSEAVVNYAKGDAKITATIGSSLSTLCPRCNIRLNGDELLAIADPNETERSPKVQRMQLGYCARSSCDSTMCQVFFHRNLGVNWQIFFDEMSLCQQNRKESTKFVDIEKQVAFRKELLRKMGRLSIGLVVICLLVMIWQWHRGGRIPYLREPEKFRVTPLPPGQKERDTQLFRRGA